MSGVAKKLMGTTAAGGGGFTAIEDVFSTYLYTGNGSTQTITNGIDLAGEGGMVWLKSRSDTEFHHVFDTERSAGEWISTNDNGPQSTNTSILSAFNNDGFSIGEDNAANNPANNYASWTFRKAPRFFDVVTYTGNGVAGREIPHNLNCEVGCIIVKRTNSTGFWYTYHKSTGATGHLVLDRTDAFTTFSGGWNNTEPTDTVFTVGAGGYVNYSGDTYVAYLFAHDPLGPSEDGSDGLIACGSYTGNGSTDGPEIDLGWEPQWVLIKRSSGTGPWIMFDNMRGIASGGDDAGLFADRSNAELVKETLSLTATGFKIDRASGFYSPDDINTSGQKYIYIAIRRGPMRAPESGTEVFDVTEQLVSRSVPVSTDFPVDMTIDAYPNNAGNNKQVFDRLRGSSQTQSRYLQTTSTNAEVSASAGMGYDNNTGYIDNFNSVGYNHVYWNFRRAPNFFDVVAYTGNGVAGRTVPHNLGVAPEMMIVRKRDAVGLWRVYHKGLNGGTNPEQYGINLNENTAAYDLNTLWNDTAPTSSVFSLGTQGNVNGSSSTYIAYLFATLAGVSKVGSYTGNGSSQTIDCGFTSGARFILIKRTDSTGDWYVWDTARGIVAANDPHLSLNTTAAEVTTDDSVDPDSSGFIVNQVAATNINVSSASYIFYAIA